ncbi:FliI/YscN family ATPase [Georgenia thermotolerans]|uniref:FliI/YscN family ATPase n=1 Tax=Georgenia thermotolerans TaxID=527326 RepID=A0A7J5ULZ4_9MICO|nr:FliI/YscN family ATPase [Georgenia thermotolerans]KAE8763399.1 FliI/YscN family ATPase [Georgenia thermotolerans]
MLDTPRWARTLAAAAPTRVGTVRSVVGLSIEVSGLPCAVGDLVDIDAGKATIGAEVVALEQAVARCMPLGPTDGLRVGAPVRGTGRPLSVGVGPSLLGRVLDGLGRPIDGRGPVGAVETVPVAGHAPSALDRARVDTPLELGVRVLDTLVTVGRGQRIGLFAGSGVGKSSLLSMIARGTEAAINVIALVGERGREVREFLEDDLGPEGLARSVVVVATSDEPPVVRLRAAFTATRIAEYFRDGGADVVLMMDSLTRAAMAQREIGLSVGEPPATRGYPPSTFSMLAQLLERAGTGTTGSVTGIYTVLVDGDNLADGHYLRLGFSIQLKKGATAELQVARALDIAIATYSGKPIDEVNDPARREELKAELLTQLSETFKGEVVDVYLTDYVTQ